ncbi:hypothetical protein B296_00026777 [Ensete ventricosum]|uniref:Uncharacterized protein n=1 Tax=Ensete ventricosum TaxID=4639 RepID=A0A427ABQ5_ENSVE|nr:hypothetical protein B296_00026777 [Ensete ventricosum]
MTAPTAHHNNWIIDSGASILLFFYLRNLFIYNNYGGNKDIIIGDSNRILIAYILLQHLIYTPIHLCSMIFCMYLTLKESLFLFFNSTNKITPLLSSFLAYIFKRIEHGSILSPRPK